MRNTDATGPWGSGGLCSGSKEYTYDENGNRLCKGESGSATNYAYVSNKNRLSSSSGGEVSSYTYDNTGLPTTDNIYDYEYGDNDHLLAVDDGETATYVYDGDGRRVQKTTDGVTTNFFYDPAGVLLSEVVLADDEGKDYVYLNGAPVGRVDWTVTEQSLGDVLVMDAQGQDVVADWSDYTSGGYDYLVRRKEYNSADLSFDGSEIIASVSDPTQEYEDPVFDDDNMYDYAIFRKTSTEDLFFYHTDHLGTPIAMTDLDGGDPVWKAEYRPFGAIHSLPYSGIENNLRFPGQYFDAETGLHQNYFRDYDPLTGRYREPDPIGQRSDTNLFVYGAADPLSFIDPDGLVVRVVTSDPAIAKILMEAYARLTRTRKGIEICGQLERSPDVYEIRPVNQDAFYCPVGVTDPKCRGKVRAVFIDPYNNVMLPTTKGMQITPKAVALAHELGHAIGFHDDGPTRMTNVLANENPVRRQLGLPLRTRYGVKQIVWVPGTK